MSQKPTKPKDPTYFAHAKLKHDGKLPEEYHYYPAFLKAFGPKPDKPDKPGQGYGLRKHDTTAPHSPDNSYWAPYSLSTPRASKCAIMLNGHATSIAALARKCGVSRHFMHVRIMDYEMDVKEAIKEAQLYLEAKEAIAKKTLEKAQKKLAKVASRRAAVGKERTKS